MRALKAIALNVVLLILADLLTPGCISAGPPGGAYMRNGRQYGVTQGRFRGRWWNHYERGRSFSDGAFWPEAERDLRTALAARGRDQLWARTYGLHFLPEYFPHRELGVALFHLGRLAEAAAELDTSLAQTASARASYFLERVRRAQLAQADPDRQAPKLDIEPVGNGTVSASAIPIRGMARDAGYVASVRVNGTPVDIRGAPSEAAFTQSVPLQSGRNAILIEAEDLSGNIARETVSVETDRQGPAVRFDRPVVLPGRVTGIAADQAGVAGMRVAGVEAALSPEPNGTVRFTADVPAEHVSPDAGLPRYRCMDILGNPSIGPVPVEVWSKGMGEAVPAAWTSETISLGSGLNGIIVHGQLMAAVAERPGAVPEGLGLRFANLADGMRFLEDAAWVTVEATGPSPLRRVELNGVSLAYLPGRGRQFLTGRVPLDLGPNRITARVEDQAGEAAECTVLLLRESTPVEHVQARLAVAMAGTVRDGNPARIEGETALVLDELNHQLDALQRFNLLDRTLLAEVLDEQRLRAALASPDARKGLGRIIPAEAYLAVAIHRDADSIEIVAQAISADTGIILSRVDAAGPGGTVEEVQSLAVPLAARLAQDFPRVQAGVNESKGEEAARNWAPVPRVRIERDAWVAAAPASSEAAERFLDGLERSLGLLGRVALVADTAENAIQAEGVLTGAFMRDGSEWRARAVLRLEALQRTESFGVSVEASGNEEWDCYRLAEAVANQAAARMPVPDTPVETMGQVLLADFGTAQRVREGMRCIVLRQGEVVRNPFTQESMGRECAILGDALIESAGRDRSRVLFVPKNASGVPAIEQGDVILVK